MGPDASNVKGYDGAGCIECHGEEREDRRGTVLRRAVAGLSGVAGAGTPPSPCHSMHPAPSYPSTFDGSRTLPRPPLDLLQGTLDLLMLKTLSWGQAHGYSVARWIERLTGDMLQIGEGSLYPALHRLEEREWIASEWRGCAEKRGGESFSRHPPRGG